ncbi:hypothetical protein QUF64_16235 [Anaerolineales bacterium HSG6]|nr:hypothetical protein [Anaerolineales bacterium HSG6]MDM8532188.1 hypothetical protein [Anaerolineales bacterium HSG25]
MSKRQTILTAVLVSWLPIMVVGALLLLFSWTVSASPSDLSVQQTASTITQTANGQTDYVTVSGLAFMPINPAANYVKDVDRQLLQIESENRVFANNNNIFVAPLVLPSHGQLMSLTLFGQDFDGRGEIRVRLKRCDNTRAQCKIVAESTSILAYKVGGFEMTQLSPINEPIDNYRYSYLLEAELTALLDSGLRAVRLEISPNQPAITPTPPAVVRWSLSGSINRLILPNTELTQVRVCTDDLSHLNNQSHYPIFVVDGLATALASSECVTTWGRDLQIRRELNAGSSSGTYEFLQ